MRRREFITLLASAAAAWPGAVLAQQGYERFIPFLIDLPGWTGLKPTSTDDEGKGGGGITAFRRSYTRDDARFSASIVFGGEAPAARNGLHVTVGGGKSATIDGFQVMTLSTPVFVMITIPLGPNAMFGLFFNNVSEDEAMTIAQKFDWKGIQALAK